MLLVSWGVASLRLKSRMWMTTLKTDDMVLLYDAMLVGGCALLCGMAKSDIYNGHIGG